jgi:hypothetical protein
LARLSTALLACVVLGVASSQAGATQRTSRLPHVVVVGDSITRLAAPSIQTALGSQYQAVLVYKNGQRIDQMLPRLDLALAQHAPVFAVVENLGTNDAREGGRLADWQASWKQLLSSTNKVSCVVLTTINLTADYLGGAKVGDSINREIENLAASDPTRYKVVPWDGFLTLAWKKHKSTFTDYMYADVIHERPPGARWLAEEDRDALADCGSSAQPSIIPPSKHLLDP